jgi:hypothetical protein
MFDVHIYLTDLNRLPLPGSALLQKRTKLFNYLEKSFLHDFWGFFALSDIERFTDIGYYGIVEPDKG